MKSNLPIGTYHNPGFGLGCPYCRSTNTSYGSLKETWECFDCGELFNRDDAYFPKPKLPKPIGICEVGVWYQSSLGTPFLITKEEAKHTEDRHIHPEHYVSPGYYEWLVEWRKTCEEIDKRAKFEDFMKTLTPEQIEQLRGGKNNGV